jgi:hypothetical protein
MLRPDGPHLFVRRKLASLGLRNGCFKRGCFLGSQLDHRLILTGKLQEHPRKLVLHSGGQGAGGFNGLFEKFCHGSSLAFPPNPWKGFRGSLLHVISAQKKGLFFNGVGFVSTAETKCAKWRRDNVPVGLREKGFEAPVYFRVSVPIYSWW